MTSKTGQAIAPPELREKSADGPGRKERRSPKGERTRARILDVAERLFGQKSYETVSQRDVADEAGLLIGLVTHHYPNKMSLFDAVIARRADELNHMRLLRLAAVETLSVEGIIDAFFEPLLELVGSESEGWHNYARLMSKMIHSEVGTDASSRYYSQTVTTFLERLAEAMPNCDRATVSRAFICSIETLLTALYRPGRYADILGIADFDDQQPARVYKSIRHYVLGGIAALINRAD
jgi:AcrR family transcriptional regulator